MHDNDTMGATAIKNTYRPIMINFYEKEQNAKDLSIPTPGIEPGPPA